MSKNKTVGRPRRVKAGANRSVYLGDQAWSWLTKQPYGASEALRQIVAEKMAIETAGAKQ